MVYTKSQAGCEACKLRKVKCNEEVPCRACARRGVKCSLTEKRFSPRHSVVRGNASQLGVQTCLVGKVSAASSHRRTHKLAPARQRKGLGWPPEKFYHWIPEDFASSCGGAANSTITYCGVVNYWSNIAYKTTPHGEVDTHLWQVEVPELALEHPVLMELMMAISSHHRAYIAHCASGQCRQRDEHAAQGSYHHERAGTLMKRALAYITHDNARVVFIASILVVISAYADGLMRYCVGKSYGPSSMLDDFILIISLSRGAKMVRDTYEVDMRPNGGERVLDIPSAEPPENGPLQDLLNLISSCKSLQREENDSMRAVCLDAMYLLEMLVRRGQASTFALAPRASLQWMCLVSDEYFRLLQAREPAALIVMSYFCAVVEFGAVDSFVFENWGRVAISEIWRIVGPQWIDVMEF